MPDEPVRLRPVRRRQGNGVRLVGGGLQRVGCQRQLPRWNSTYKYRNDRLDADRHCLWQALTTESSNADFAKQVGDAHEEDGAGGNGTNAGLMDQYNNITGRKVGLDREGDRQGIRNYCYLLATNARVVTDISTLGTNTSGDELVVLEGAANTAG